MKIAQVQAVDMGYSSVLYSGLPMTTKQATEQSEQPILYDRSRTVTDWTCPRARLLGYELDGRGLTPQNIALPLALGIVMHDAMAGIAQQQQQGVVDIDLIADKVFQTVFETLLSGGENAPEYCKEQAALSEGLIRGFYRHVWPRLLYTHPHIVAIEREMLFPHDGLVFMAKPDLILANDAGDWRYCEYKSTSSKKEEWVQSWNTAVQLHSTLRAVEHTLGQMPQDVQIVGLYKGYQGYGRQNSVFCSGHKRSGEPPFTKDEISYEYRSGFKRVPTWELRGGLKTWVANMPDDILADQFPTTPPIFINPDLVDDFFAQRAIREREIADGMKVLSDVNVSDVDKRRTILRVFPQKFDKCRPPYGEPCQFIKVCHGHISDPLTQGFSYREPHHQLELDIQQASTSEPSNES